MESDQRPSAAATNETKEAIAENWDGLLFDIRRSIRYHSKRANFFGFLNKVVVATSIIFGSTVVALVMSQCKIITIASGAIITIFSTISLVWGYSQKEQLHSELKIRFIDLEKSITKCENPDEKSLKENISERLSIETSEPKIVRTLNAVCYNEQAIAQGYEQQVKLNWLRRLLYQIDLPFLDITIKSTKANETPK